METTKEEEEEEKGTRRRAEEREEIYTPVQHDHGRVESREERRRYGKDHPAERGNIRTSFSPLMRRSGGENHHLQKEMGNDDKSVVGKRARIRGIQRPEMMDITLISSNS